MCLRANLEWIERPMTNLLLATNLTDVFDGDRVGYQGQPISDIIQRESAHELAAEMLLCVRIPGGQAFGCNSDDRHLLTYMPQLKRLYTVILASDDPPVVSTSVWCTKQPGYRLTGIGKRILRACQYFAHREGEGRDWQNVYAHHKFHPVFAVLFRAVMQRWKTICLWEEPALVWPEGGTGTEAVEGLRHFVRFVRRVCRSQAFKNLLHDHERKEEGNFRSGCDYITEQFELHSRLLVLRIDLYFRPDARGWGYGKEADKAVKNYLRALRLCRIVPGYLGFIIKRENGISRGMHYHLMVFLDGHLHRNANYLTQVMGEAWMKRVGVDRGSYFNCYANRHLYHYNGLGPAHVSDIEKLIGIRVALWYMSKQDSVLKVDDSKVKNFWRGWKVKGDSSRGAPRKNGDGMDLVRRLLGGGRSKYPPGLEPPKKET